MTTLPPTQQHAGTGPMGAALNIAGLVRRYGSVKAVDGLSLSVAAGEFVTLLGPSGSGKTTTLKMIAGFDRADSGSIHLGAQDLTTLPPSRRNIGMVFQHYALFPHMSVFDNVAFPLQMRRRARREIEAAVGEALAMVHIGELSQRLPRELSGGQQQRVALARALVFRPPLLLMDEPLAALDHQLRREVQAEVKRLHQSLGMTIIFVTHDQAEAMFLSDRIAVMRGGRIVQVGSPATLYSQPANRFVASFVGDSNLIAGRVLAVERNLARIDIPTVASFMAQAGPGLRPGGDVSCLLRPEKILLTRGSGPGLEGAVVLASFVGNSLEFEVSTPIGMLKVRAPVDAHGAPLVPGTAVRLRWAEQDLLALPAEDRA